MSRHETIRPTILRGSFASFVTLTTSLILLALLTVQSTPPVQASPMMPGGDAAASAGASPSAGPLRLVNMPYFGTSAIPFPQTAVFWLGRLTAGTQYADIRMGYNNTEILVNANVMDAYLWYNANTPSPSNLARYDSVSLYLSENGTGISAPNSNTYRFDAQFTWWETNRARWQAAYRGNGSAWSLASLSFKTQSGWRGDQPNNAGMDRGFTITYHIPFSALGLSGPPAKGTMWGLGVALHNRNDAAGTAIADQVWPEYMAAANPSTWGLLRFGLPAPLPVPPATGLQTVVIKNRLNGQVATTTNVGGYTQCGENIGNFGLGYYQQWGIQNWVGTTYLNVMNQSDIADWPCYNKVYAMFPLSSIPAGKAITSARLTFYQYGHAGTAGQTPGPSLIQLFTTDTAWTPGTINWNNAPRPTQNVAQQWAGTGSCPSYLNCPSVTWDVLRAVTTAYKVGQPLRLILYDSDHQISSGKYLFASETGDWNAANRPVLRVTFGNP